MASQIHVYPIQGIPISCLVVTLKPAARTLHWNWLREHWINASLNYLIKPCSPNSLCLFPPQLKHTENPQTHRSATLALHFIKGKTSFSCGLIELIPTDILNKPSRLICLRHTTAFCGGQEQFVRLFHNVVSNNGTLCHFTKCGPWNCRVTYKPAFHYDCLHGQINGQHTASNATLQLQCQSVAYKSLLAR